MTSETIQKLNYEISQCYRCLKSSPAILKGRKLLGKEDQRIDILILGEAPKQKTYDAREQRDIFGPYSPTGKRILTFLNLFAEEYSDLTCWGTNCVKCDVKEDYIFNAISNCRGFLHDEIELLNPKVIIMLGSKVIKNMVNEKLNVGQVTSWNGYTCIHSYHPMERTGRFLKYMNIVKSSVSKNL